MTLSSLAGLWRKKLKVCCRRGTPEIRQRVCAQRTIKMTNVLRVGLHFCKSLVFALSLRYPNRKGIIQSLSGLQVYTGRLLHYDFAKSTVQKFIPLQIVCGFFLVKLHVFVTSVQEIREILNSNSVYSLSIFLAFLFSWRCVFQC